MGALIAPADMIDFSTAPKMPILLTNTQRESSGNQPFFGAAHPAKWFDLSSHPKGSDYGSYLFPILRGDSLLCVDPLPLHLFWESFLSKTSTSLEQYPTNPTNPRRRNPLSQKSGLRVEPKMIFWDIWSGIPKQMWWRWTPLSGRSREKCFLPYSYETAPLCWFFSSTIQKRNLLYKCSAFYRMNWALRSSSNCFPLSLLLEGRNFPIRELWNVMSRATFFPMLFLKTLSEGSLL